MSLFSALPIAGIKIIQSDFATKDGGQAKKFPRRKAKTEAHFRRMNKKWLRRYGIIREPAMYWMDTSLVGGPDRVLVCHPVLYAKVRAAVSAPGDRR